MIVSFKDKYAFLSNFYPCKVLYEGYVYPSSEHAFQAAKTDNLILREQIRNAPTPSLAKSYGRQIPKRFFNENWDIDRDGVMLRVLRAKFKNKQLAQRLRDTGEEELVETNTWNDVYWEVCLGKGENKLGKLLMRVREELNNSSSAKSAYRKAQEIRK